MLTASMEDARPPAASCAAAPHDAHRLPPYDVICLASTLLDASRFVCELLNYMSADLCRRTERITRLVMDLVDELNLERRWELEAAARLSQIGLVALGRDALDAVARGELLDDDADRAYASHPLVARDLLADVRQLDTVREMIARQREPFAVAGAAPGVPSAEARAALGGQLLHVAVDAEMLLSRGVAPAAVVESLQALPDEYDPDLVAALAACVGRTAGQSG